MDYEKRNSNKRSHRLVLANVVNTCMCLLKATIHDYVIAAYAQIQETVSPCLQHIAGLW